jgi:hypothetical protein
MNMKMKGFSYIMAVVLLGFFTPGNVRAQSDTDEVRLQTMQREAEEDASKRGQTKHVELLSQRFQVQPSVIEELRSSKQGWGEITTRLAIAEHLTKTDPTNFPTLDVALQRVGDLRNDKRGWGNIGKELGFKLGPVVSDVKQSLQDLRREGQTGQLKMEKADNRSELKREARLDRLERTQRPERPERPQRSERPERPERLGK